eukprot:CAMPEP_0170627452 /NCGR_PEP_ID=MMETSP0224-20130122/31981_1 /TAXON_ID=285029 /ORGANISM="Togula jolla, Strain CCCM 725" /LENGTH=83 /DNA_ID=CAMNT_0010954457 /DNA_START=137 /DNA_END=388 /DNA_ORIENTATION=-
MKGSASCAMDLPNLGLVQQLTSGLSFGGSGLPIEKEWAQPDSDSADLYADIQSIRRQIAILSESLLTVAAKSRPGPHHEGAAQ